MTGLSIEGVMNGLASIGLPEDAAETLTSVQAFMAVDPLLASLHKQSVDAKARYASLVKNRGKRDPMTVVAADMYDSADSAFRTRLIEVKRNCELRSRARALSNKLKALADIERNAKGVRRHARMQEEYHRQRRGQLGAARREAEDSHALLLWLWWMLYFTSKRATRALSLASAFAQVNDNNGAQRAAKTA